MVLSVESFFLKRIPPFPFLIFFIRVFVGFIRTQWLVDLTLRKESTFIERNSYPRPPFLFYANLSYRLVQDVRGILQGL